MPDRKSDTDQDTCLGCGNPVPPEAALCPYCGDTGREVTARVVIQELDIGHANMTAREASESLAVALDDVQAFRVPLLLVVHGYGSSGQGGIIRKVVHTVCRAWQSEGRIKAWLPGERLGPATDLARGLARDRPELSKSIHWNAGNRGITLIVC